MEIGPRQTKTGRPGTEGAGPWYRALVDLYARVNILEGKAVRLPRGSIKDAIFLDADPVDRAKSWVAKGADRLHIVDLDAAAKDDHRNRALIRDIIDAAGVPVQVGGGVRSQQDVEETLDAGAWRVVMGTTAMIDQVLFWELCREHPGRIVVSVDVLADEELAIRGWTEGSGQYLEEALIELSSAGTAGFMISEVGRDALEEPPNYEFLSRALSIVDEDVIAAGGVRNLDDMQELMQLDVDDKSVAGVVVGREVTAGRFTIEEAVALLQNRTGHQGPWSPEQLESAAAAFSDDPETADPDAAGAERFVRWLGAG